MVNKATVPATINPQMIGRFLPLKILLVDEDVFSRDRFQRTLEEEGFDVVCTNGKQQAHDLLLTYDGPQIAILSWSTVGKDAPGMCRGFGLRIKTESSIS
jgi:PleD family two-component response regulator